MTRKKKKKLKHQMNEEATATKTNDGDTIASEADISSDEETTTKKMTDQNTEYTESSAAELSLVEENSTTSKQKSSKMTPPELQPHSKVANHNLSFDLTKEEEKSMSLTDSERLVVDEANRKSEELSSIYLSDSPNITKDLHPEAPELTENETEEILDRNVGEPKIIDFYRRELPTLKDMMDERLDSGDRDERILRKGQYAHAVLNSPLGLRNYAAEKERQLQERESQKSLHCTYETAEFSDVKFTNIELLQATAKHIERKNIEAFYKVGEGVFIVVLQTPEHKQAFPKVTNFQEKIRDNKVNFRILDNKPIKTKFNVRRSYLNKDDTVFVTMFLPTLISDAAVKKVFQEFGEMHSVFFGKYRDEEEFNFIRNGKRHIS